VLVTQIKQLFELIFFFFGFNPFYVRKKKLNIVRRKDSFQEDVEEIKNVFSSTSFVKKSFVGSISRIKSYLSEICGRHIQICL
jgi:hypothetical protein